MLFDTYEVIAVCAAVLSILMLGTTHLRAGLGFYSIHTFAIALETILIARVNHDNYLYWVAFFLILFKAIIIPNFLTWVMKEISVETDIGSFMVAPLSMITGIGMLGVSYLLAAQLPGLPGDSDSKIGAMAAMSIIFTGVLLMLARKIAISQIVGFLVLENGIYLFALTQTHGMPLIFEIGFLLEILVGVMLFGLLLFRIKKSFEHIDVTQLTELKE